jgi:TPR repeat protein
MDNLAGFYIDARGGLPKSNEEAVRLLTLAAGQGYANAESRLGYF